jgi:uncharacterized membrane protein
MPSGEPVPFTTVELIIRERCIQCHSASPTDSTWKQPPLNVMFDTPDLIKKYSERIKTRAVITRTMPLGNKTGMTDDERQVLAQWFLQGARTE